MTHSTSPIPQVKKAATIPPASKAYPADDVCRLCTMFCEPQRGHPVAIRTHPILTEAVAALGCLSGAPRGAGAFRKSCSRRSALWPCRRAAQSRVGLASPRTPRTPCNPRVRDGRARRRRRYGPSLPRLRPESSAGRSWCGWAFPSADQGRRACLLRICPAPTVLRNRWNRSYPIIERLSGVVEGNAATAAILSRAVHALRWFSTLRAAERAGFGERRSTRRTRPVSWDDPNRTQPFEALSYYTDGAYHRYEMR